MKKYLIPLAALLMVAGMTNAQSTPKKTTASNPVAKMNKPAVKNASTTASVSPSASTPAKKTSTVAAIKRKHYHKKIKSVKPEGSK